MPSRKAEQIALVLREEILSGERPPGAKLPTYDALMEQFRVTRPTVARVLDALPATPLRVVAVGKGAKDGSLLHALGRRFEGVVAQAAALAAYVVIDTPPVAEVGDALMVASFADELIVVGRAGWTDRGGVRLMAELFSRSGLAPAGWILLGEQSAHRRYYSDYLVTADVRARSDA